LLVSPDDVTADEAAAVFRRAAELDQRGATNGHRALDIAALEQAGLEAGLSRNAIRQALAEVKAGAVEPIRPRTHAVVARTLAMDPGDLEAAVDAFMRQQNCKVVRNLGDRVVWLPDRSMWGNIRRTLDFKRRIVLREVGEVTTCVVPIPGEEGRAHVRFEVDMARVRRGWNAIPAAVGVAGVGGAVALGFGIGLPVEAIAAPAAAALTGGAVAGARAGYRGSVRRNVTVIERFLDLLEHGR
jgi:hypothetical protein